MPERESYTHNEEIKEASAMAARSYISEEVGIRKQILFWS